jgi:hypothetical protein
VPIDALKLILEAFFWISLKGGQNGYSSPSNGTIITSTIQFKLHLFKLYMGFLYLNYHWDIISVDVQEEESNITDIQEDTEEHVINDQLL